jgi:hypothetical protein
VLAVQASIYIEDELDDVEERSEMIYSSYQNFLSGNDVKLPKDQERIRRDVDGKKRRRRNNRSKKPGKSRNRFRPTTTQTTVSPDDLEGMETNSSLDALTSSCPICDQRKKHQEQVIERIRLEILAKLDMIEPPSNFTMPPYNLPDYLKSNYSNNEPPEPVSEVTTIFTFAERCKYECIMSSR